MWLAGTACRCGMAHVGCTHSHPHHAFSLMFRVHLSSRPRSPIRCSVRGIAKVTYLLIVSESPITQRCRFGLVMATLSLLFSPKKPTSCSGLLRTVLTTTASFSRPWNPSTEPSSRFGYFSLSKPERSASYAIVSFAYSRDPLASSGRHHRTAGIEIRKASA